jgi:transposase
MLDAVSEAEDGHTSDHKSARRQRIEVITRGERRRRWTAEEKRDIALESLEPGTSAITVARKHGISSGQLYTWRQQLLRDAVGAAGERKPGFVRIDVVPAPSCLEVATPAAPALSPPAPPPERPTAPSPAQPDGRIEITLSRGVSVRVDAKVDSAALRRVLAALERS